MPKRRREHKNVQDKRKGTEASHYLLATPFRYPPLKVVGTRSEPSLFYGWPETRTVPAEAASYRFVFWSGMATPRRQKSIRSYPGALPPRLSCAPKFVH